MAVTGQFSVAADTLETPNAHVRHPVAASIDSSLNNYRCPASWRSLKFPGIAVGDDGRPGGRRLCRDRSSQ
jgi:hypothetical protein